MSYPSQPQGPEHRYTAPGWPPPTPRPRPWLWVGAVALALIVGGAAVALSNDSEPSRAEQAASALPEPNATPAAVPPPATSATVGLAAAKPLKVGQTHSFTANDGGKVAVTVLKHQVHEETYGIQVRTCNRGSTVFIASPYPWFLSYGGGEELSQDSITGGGLLAPEFTQGDLQPGGCRKGWLSFVKSGKPDGAEYRIEGETRARWEF